MIRIFDEESIDIADVPGGVGRDGLVFYEKEYGAKPILAVMEKSPPGLRMTVSSAILQIMTEKVSCLKRVRSIFSSLKSGVISVPPIRPFQRECPFHKV